VLEESDLALAMVGHIITQPSADVAAVRTLIDRDTSNVVVSCQPARNIGDQNQFGLALGNLFEHWRCFDVIGWQSDDHIRLKGQKAFQLFALHLGIEMGVGYGQDRDTQ
jgi:hypothetical protein